MAKSLDIINPKEEDDESPKPEDNSGEEQFKIEPKGGGGVFYLVIGIIAVVVATGAALYILYSDSGKGEEEDQTLQTAVSDEESGEAVLEGETLAPAEDASPTAAPVKTPAAFSYSDESIRVVNGNGITGEAAKIRKVLEDEGMKVASISNAKKMYDQSVIFYKSGQEALAQALKDAISEYYAAELTESNETVGTYDAIVALGAK